MTLIYINSRFPKTKKLYERAGDDNTEKLKEVMSKLTIASKEPEAPVSVPQPRAGGSTWAYSDRRKKAKTFKL